MRGTRRPTATMPSREKVNFPCAGALRLGLVRQRPLLKRYSMIKAARIALSLVAVAGVGATFAACGGVPGNAVATVDGEAIDKKEFNHWLTVAAKSSGQQNAAVPDPTELRQVRRRQAQDDAGARQGPAEGDGHPAQDAVQDRSTTSCATRSSSS